MNQNSLSEFMTLALVILFLFLIIMLFALIVQLKKNDDLRNQILELENIHHSLRYKANNLKIEVDFQKSVNKTILEGLEAITNKKKNGKRN